MNAKKKDSELKTSFTPRQLLEDFAKDILTETDTEKVIAGYSRILEMREDSLVVQNPTVTSIAKEWVRCVTHPEYANGTFIRIKPSTEKQLLRILKVAVAVIFAGVVLMGFIAWNRYQDYRDGNNVDIIRSEG